MRDNDAGYVRAAIDVARSARDNGNHPFGAVLVDRAGNILERAENSVVTEKDCTGHAETNLMRLASQKYDPEFLGSCTLYSSAEPCAMCAAAIFWGNVGRVVYGLSAEALYSMGGTSAKEVLSVSCRDVIRQGNKEIEVLGPMIEEEAKAVHDGFWI